MIFRPELVEKILAGEKTQTRRKVKPGVPCRYLVSHDYALQPGRGKHGVARIRVTAHRIEQLGDLGPEDAKREGFASTVDFVSYWVGLYGGIDLAQEVDVISFELWWGT